MGERHKLEKIVIMNPDGTMNDAVPQNYRGLDRFACRKAVLADLEQNGHLVKTEDHQHKVGHCQRCETVTEPYLSKQWFVKYDAWVAPAVKALKDGTLRFHPPKWEKTFTHWMENIRDWCISRQLWWGHRIPAWYCSCGEVIVSRTTPAVCPRCKGSALTQDEDVLDTWFSSWLWPFSTMGWPQDNDTLKKFYPTNTLVTAPDIIFFWVARMVFAGQEFMGNLPFEDVYFTSLVRDMKGRKMSKSLGNSSDPIDLINTYGADALRYTIVSLAPVGQDVLFADDKCELGRNFANKLWNASRFLLGNIETPLSITAPVPAARLKAEDRWMQSRLNRAIQSVNNALNEYRFSEAAHVLYEIVWRDFCDWYIEIKKGDLYQETNAQRKADAFCQCCTTLGTLLKLLHPLMPFITEEIWSHLRAKVSFDALLDHESVLMSCWPVTMPAAIDDAVERDFELLMNVVVALRTIRSENNITPDKKGRAIIIPADAAQCDILKAQRDVICMLARLDAITVDMQAAKPSFAGQSVVNGIQIILELEGLIDRAVEIDRISKEIERSESFLAIVDKKLSGNFAERAPAEVVAKEREKQESIKRNLEQLRKSLDSLKQ